MLQMRISLPLITLFFTSVDCKGAGLRSSAGANDQSPQRALKGNYHPVHDAMISYYGNNRCTTKQVNNQFITNCSMPGSTATFNTREKGIRNSPTRPTLEVCHLQTGGNIKCETYIVDKNSQDIIATAFPKGPGSRPTQSPTQSPSSKENYNDILDVMVHYFDGGCSVNISGGNTLVSCSDEGYNAELTAQKTTSQIPHQLKTCEIQSGRETNCHRYNFNDSTTVKSILSKAFPHYGSSGDYADILETMLEYFNGACVIDLTKGNTVVSCSKPGHTVNLNADGTKNQTPKKLESCKLDMGKGGDTVCKAYNFNGSMSNTRAILAAALP